MISVYYGTDDSNGKTIYREIGALATSFTQQTISIHANIWKNGIGKFKMVNGGSDGVS